MKTQRIVPIVFAINNYFVPYCGVTIKSLIMHTSEDYLYKIHVFHTELSEYNIERLESMSTSNVEIKCMDVSCKIPNVELKNKNHISKETLYRIIAPSILEEYDKILYLDSDIVVLKDVAELYETDMGDCVIGAAEELMLKKFAMYIESRNMDRNGYFNTGVLLLNAKKFLENDILNGVIEILKTDVVYNYPDQDALNILCKGNVCYIATEWNVEWHLMWDEPENILEEQVARARESQANPYIIHYTSQVKAWTRPDLKYADAFWKYARQTAFYEEIIFNNMPKQVSASKEKNAFDRFVFPWKHVACDSRIIIYGAGEVGRQYLKQLEMTRYCSVLAVADKRKDSIKDVNAMVILPGDIKEFSYDKILIAIENQRIAEEIKGELFALGYDEAKIVWASPNK